jgi:hypothetical protein
VAKMEDHRRLSKMGGFFSWNEFFVGVLIIGLYLFFDLLLIK